MFNVFAIGPEVEIHRMTTPEPLPRGRTRQRLVGVLLPLFIMEGQTVFEVRSEQGVEVRVVRILVQVVPNVLRETVQVVVGYF